jgi:transcriptional regulator with GAF, ATPase, and Fis domain
MTVAGRAADELAVWVHCIGIGSGSSRVRRVVDALSAEGIAGSASGATLGVVLIDEITDDVVSFVRGVTVEGDQRVLAVVVGDGDPGAPSCWRLLAAGAGDVIAWDRSDQPAADVSARLQRWQAVDELMAAPMVRDTLVGSSPAWRRVVRQIVEVAHFTSLSLLVTGESGTGKELVAHLVHALDTRRDKGDLVVLDCTTVVPSLSGSEFFGHERGAFTGAVSQRLGAFGAADGGTLFLDEVGELPLQLQAELLRVIQEGSYKRVGSNTWHSTRFRLICATNRDLAEEEQRGAFRRDFYHRIAAWRCHLPSLRDRARDILPLAEHFVRQGHPGHSPPGFDPEVSAFLSERSYPGNVRELRTFVERILQRHVGQGPITVGDVPDDERPDSEPGAIWRSGHSLETGVQHALAAGASLKEIADMARDTAIRLAVAQEGGSLQKASRVLAVSDRALQLRRAAQAHP